MNLLFALYISMQAGTVDPAVLEGFDRGQAIPVNALRLPGVDGDGKPLYLREDAAQAFLAMAEAALRDGFFIKPNYAWRSMDQQRDLYRRGRRWAAKPGHSEHQAGLAVDINGCRERRGRHWRPTQLHHWLTSNAPRFGFAQTIKKELWHWEYRGIRHPMTDLISLAEENT